MVKDICSKCSKPGTRKEISNGHVWECKDCDLEWGFETLFKALSYLEQKRNREAARKAQNEKVLKSLRLRNQEKV